MSESEENKSRSGGGALKYFFWLFVITILAGFGCFLYLTDKGMDMTKESITQMIRALKPVKVVDCFHEWCELQVKGNEGNILEVATGEETVEMSRNSSVEMFGKTVPFLKPSSKVIVPATFRYHIDLRGYWNMIEDDRRLHVIAPDLEPSLPVAYDSAKMQRVNAPGISKFISGSNMAELEKTITPELESRAQDIECIKQYEPEAKKSIAKFLKTWLIGEELWQEGKIEEIIVYFNDEIVDTSNPNIVPDAVLEIPQPVLN